MKHFGYPIQLNLRDRRVLVAGAGRVATRKIERLVEACDGVHVIALDASAPVRKLAEQGKVALSLREARDQDVNGMLLVLCATDRGDVNAQLARAARAAGALVSRVDAPEDSDFTVPAMAFGEHVAATVSTGGLAPSASRRLGRELSTWLAHGPDRFVQEIARARRALAQREDASERLRRLGSGPLFEACRAVDEAQIAALLSAELGANP